MKTKQKLLFLLPLLFLFAPLFSFAQFITTNAPCEPEIIPPLGQVEGVYCPYCPNKGEYLHLKWDLKTNFQDPVCGIECWGPSGDQCSDSWYSGEKFFDQNGNRKTKLKPKDDVFIKGPPVSTRSAVPGTNLQVHCWEKNDASDPSKKKTSAGIRVYSDNACGEPAVGEPCEVPFANIALSLLSAQPTTITETGGSSWSEIDGKDFCYYTNGLCKENSTASGDVRDIKDFMINLQLSANGSHLEDFYQNRSLSILKEAFEAGDIVPIVIDGKMHGHNLYPEGHDIQHALVAYDLIMDGDNVVIKIVDPNDPLKEDNSLTCTKKDLSPGYASVTCRNFYFGKAFMDNVVVMVVRNQIDYRPLYYRFKERHDSFCSTNTNSNLCQGTAKERLLGNWRLSLKNIPDPTIFYGYNDGFCYAWTFTQTSLVYLGDFVGYDYHPNDGKIVGRDCDENHYPINKSLKETKTLKSSQLGSLNWLANAWSGWQRLFK